MTDKPLRADARRNRAKVLETAQQAFAAEGLGVSPDEIARRAGVGVGTVYRHFPTKEDLFEAVMLSRMQQLVQDADAAAASPDPGAAFFGYLAKLVTEGSAKRDLVDALAGAGVDVTAAMSDIHQEYSRAMATLLAQAQRAGAVREDIGPADLMAVLAGVFLAARRQADPGLQERVWAIVRDGLRA